MFLKVLFTPYCLLNLFDALNILVVAIVAGTLMPEAGMSLAFWSLGVLLWSFATTLLISVPMQNRVLLTERNPLWKKFG